MAWDRQGEAEWRAGRVSAYEVGPSAPGLGPLGVGPVGPPVLGPLGRVPRRRLPPLWGGGGLWSGFRGGRYAQPPANVWHPLWGARGHPGGMPDRSRGSRRASADTPGTGVGPIAPWRGGRAIAGAGPVGSVGACPVGLVTCRAPPECEGIAPPELLSLAYSRAQRLDGACPRRATMGWGLGAIPSHPIFARPPQGRSRSGPQVAVPPGPRPHSSPALRGLVMWPGVMPRRVLSTKAMNSATSGQSGDALRISSMAWTRFSPEKK